MLITRSNAQIVNEIMLELARYEIKRSRERRNGGNKDA